MGKRRRSESAGSELELTRSGLSAGELDVIIPARKSKKKDAQSSLQTKFEQALEAYKPRPDKGVVSRKKDQRFAGEIKEYLKEQKRVKSLQDKSQQEIERRKKREELFARLQKNALEKSQREQLQGSSDLARPVASTERLSGKVGERQRRKTSKRKGENPKSSRIVTFAGDDDDESSSSEEETEPIVEKMEVIAETKKPLEDDHLEEETGIVISRTPPPVEPNSGPVPLVMARKKQQSATSSAAKRPRSASTASVTKPSSQPAIPNVVVRFPRPETIAQERLALPVCGMEQEIMEAIRAHSIVFVCGETGSGKTTQVPQFLLEAGFGYLGGPAQTKGMVCVSQPRRVAAVSVAERVAVELGCPIVRHVGRSKKRGDRAVDTIEGLTGCVGYQIRHDADTVDERCTRLKFCTDGILLRECRGDFLLSKYSCIVLDEVHERGLNSDLLLGMLSRIVPMRERLSQENPAITPLKLVLMSATLDVEDFARLGFPTSSPVVRVAARQHPVTPHFSKRTELVDYLGATFKKVCRVHEKLPPGGVLVFLPGQREIEWMCRKLRERYNGEESEEGEQLSTAKPESDHAVLAELGAEDADDDEGDDDAQAIESTGVSNNKDRLRKDDHKAKSSVTEADMKEENDGGEANEMSDLESDDEGDGKSESEEASNVEASLLNKRVHVVPLFSRLSPAKQRLALQPSEDPEIRFIVVSTNVAETSLTIPGIRFVVDSGRERRRAYDPQTGTSAFKVDWISQQSAVQRMGRAGRTGPGHCYRVYSSAVFQDVLQPKTPPEMQVVPIDDLVLYMKSLGIDRVIDFPFPTALDSKAVAASVVRLQRTGLLSSIDKDAPITKLGIAAAKLPLPFRLAKQVVVAEAEEKLRPCLMHVVALASLMSLPSPFDSESGASRVFWSKTDPSDCLALLRVAGAYSFDQSDAFCVKHGLNVKTMSEFRQVCGQLMQNILQTSVANDGDLKQMRQGVLPRLRPLTASEEELIKQTVVSGSLDRIARKLDGAKARAFAQAKGQPFPPRSMREWPYEPCEDSLQSSGILTLTLHPKTYFSKTETEGELPELVAFGSVDDKGRMDMVTRVEASWLRQLAEGTQQCVDKPVDVPEASYVQPEDCILVPVRPLYGDKRWELPLERVRVDEVAPNDIAELFRHAIRAFARAILEGKVAGRFVDETEASAPFAQCTRPVLQPRVANLVARLLRAGVASKRSLLAKWKQDSSFLKAEIGEWVRSEYRSKFEAQWINRVKSALASK